MSPKANEPLARDVARDDDPPRHKVVRLGILASDPSACDAIHARDPESAAIHPAITDSLVYVDSEGHLQPGLATAWRRIDPLTMEFDLREGVRFHNGDPFTGADVVATIRAQQARDHLGLNGRAVLATVTDCKQLDEFRLQVRTRDPDSILLHRLHVAGAIYPRSILASKGSKSLLHEPVGTGAYIFDSWQRGHEIVLRKNPDHWSDRVQIDELRLPIIDRKDWIDALRAGHLDIAWGIDPHDAMRLDPAESLQIARRPVGLSHWFLLGTRGALADERVRLALNYAVHRHLLCNVVCHGHAQPQSALSQPGEAGYDPSLAPYPYDPEHARLLLRQAGYGDGLRLHGLVCESSNALFELVRVFLSSVGVQLDAEIVPRAQWLARTMARRIDLGLTYEGDFALVDLPNLFGNNLLQHAMFLHSGGPFSILTFPEYDRRLSNALARMQPDEFADSMRSLERFAYDRALLLYSIRQELCCVSRTGFHMAMSATGLPTCDALWSIDYQQEPQLEQPSHPVRVRTDVADLQRLLDATTYPGTLYDTEPSEGPVLARLWRNIELHQERWHIQTEQMLRTMVDLVAATVNLENVLRSTKQVAILGVTKTGRVLFENSGYQNVMGHDGSMPLSKILFDDEGYPAWYDIKALTDASGVCNEILNVRVSDSDQRRIFMSMTPALNENGDSIGYVCIATDHSKEEEQLRIRQEVELARRIQAALLPTVEEDQAETLSAIMLPAEEVGGDYYDIFDADNGHTWYGIGDVSGHGVTSGLMMLMGRAIIRALIREKPEISMNELLCVLNRVLYDDIQQMGDAYHFTVSLIKSLGNGDFVAAGAHEDIIVYRAASGECERIELTGIWVGFIPEVDGMFEEVELHLEPGDTMVLYTDGILEATAEDGTMWESRRFIESIKRHAHLSAHDMRVAIVEDVEDFMDVRDDDMTMMIIRRPRTDDSER